MVVLVVVCFPNLLLLDISLTLSSKSGIRELISEDLPTPDCPRKICVLSISRVLKASKFVLFLTLKK